MQRFVSHLQQHSLVCMYMTLMMSIPIHTLLPSVPQNHTGMVIRILHLTNTSFRAAAKSLVCETQEFGLAHPSSKGKKIVNCVFMGVWWWTPAAASPSNHQSKPRWSACVWPSVRNLDRNVKQTVTWDEGHRQDAAPSPPTPRLFSLPSAPTLERCHATLRPKPGTLPGPGGKRHMFDRKRPQGRDRSARL